jgi:hypothetical protein
MSDTNEFIFSISEEEVNFLRTKRNNRVTKKIPTEDILAFLQSYNEMINHRQKKLPPRQMKLGYFEFLKKWV